MGQTYPFAGRIRLLGGKLLETPLVGLSPASDSQLVPLATNRSNLGPGVFTNAQGARVVHQMLTMGGIDPVMTQISSEHLKRREIDPRRQLLGQRGTSQSQAGLGKLQGLRGALGVVKYREMGDKSLQCLIEVLWRL